MPAPKQLIEQLIQLANEMDENGMEEEADNLTRTAQLMMDEMQSDEFDPSEWEEMQPDGADVFGEDGDTSKYISRDSYDRVREFADKLEEMSDNVSSVDELEARANALAKTQFEDISFETDDMIANALATYLRNRPGHLNSKILSSAFPSRAHEFEKTLQDAGLNINQA